MTDSSSTRREQREQQGEGYGPRRTRNPDPLGEDAPVSAPPTGEADEAPERVADAEPEHHATELRPARGIPAASVGRGAAPTAVTAAAVPGRAAAIAAPPAFAAARLESHAAGAAAPKVLGGEPDRVSLATEPRSIRPLESAPDVLPELEQAPETARPVWKHPAFLVSAITTLLALIALAVFIVLGILSPRAEAYALTLTVTPDNVQASWSGPDVPYQLIVLGGPRGEEVDMSQLVEGTAAWIPSAGFVDADSCIVVRPAAGNEQAPVALDADTVSAQAGSSACVADANE